jgi:hypothetical protein
MSSATGAPLVGAPTEQSETEGLASSRLGRLVATPIAVRSRCGLLVAALDRVAVLVLSRSAVAVVLLFAVAVSS